MKKLLFGLIATVLFANISFAQIKEGNVISVNDVYEQISQTTFELERENYALIDFEYNKETQNLTITKISQEEPRFFVLENSNETTEKKYTVSCALSNGKDWTKTCDGKFSCGSLIADCLDAGGCATICNAKFGYNPKTYSLYTLFPNKVVKENSEFITMNVKLTNELIKYKFNSVKDFDENSDRLLEDLVNDVSSLSRDEKCEVTVEVSVTVNTGVVSKTLTASVTASCSTIAAQVKKIRKALIASIM